MRDYQLPPADVCRDLISVYFDTLDHTEASLFHHQSFLQAFDKEEIPLVTLLALFALAARFSDHSYFQNCHRWARGLKWRQEAKTLFNLQVMNVSLSTLQGCRLLSSLAAAEGDSDTVSICNGLSTCVASLLDLPRNLSKQPLRREIELRVLATVYMTDVWVSSGRDVKRLSHFDETLPWPIGEVDFRNLTEENVEDEITTGDVLSRRSCMWSQMIPLTNIFGQINDLNHGMDCCEDDQASDLAKIGAVSLDLAYWQRNLPDRLQDETQNLAYFASINLGHVFVALHVGFHYYHVLLYYRFLHFQTGQAIPESQLEYSLRCKTHAVAITNLIWSSCRDFNVNCTWLMVSHVLVISSSVHLHTFLLNPSDEAVSEARSLLERNFQLLTRLCCYWPWLDQAMSRLKAFQEACLRAREVSDVFKMNSWLRHFLHVYDKAVANDDTNAPCPSPHLFTLDNLACFPSS
ncbi:C6 transcription factor [Pochonia chlamydosporia 170]|uniref:C6 transcription factor n=1 Tax=Pochonia chlamydosporia 170 TaxID=1380566 RepID=A0A219ANR2_METCM|nr:C6 transcription factor [Pochonia chlamydosporia 170]OWT42477.1 C6 transcription factor [Pochonia chlamydosporia 170]